MSIAKKYAEQGYEEAPKTCTRTVGKHGIGKAARKIVKYYKRIGARAEERMAFGRRPR